MLGTKITNFVIFVYLQNELDQETTINVENKNCKICNFCSKNKTNISEKQLLVSGTKITKFVIFVNKQNQQDIETLFVKANFLKKALLRLYFLTIFTGYFISNKKINIK